MFTGEGSMMSKFRRFIALTLAVILSTSNCFSLVYGEELTEEYVGDDFDSDIEEVIETDEIQDLSSSEEDSLSDS